jgi:hypothetical protein
MGDPQETIPQVTPTRDELAEKYSIQPLAHDVLAESMSHGEIVDRMRVIEQAAFKAGWDACAKREATPKGDAAPAEMSEEEMQNLPIERQYAYRRFPPSKVCGYVNIAASHRMGYQMAIREVIEGRIRLTPNRERERSEMKRLLLEARKVWFGLRFFERSFQGWYVLASYHHPDSITWRWSISFDPRRRGICWPKFGPGYSMGTKFLSPNGYLSAWLVFPLIGTFSLSTQAHMWRVKK